jgi:endonuclease/exonuclease/phosphatase family metal-dependent hydrolase
LPKAGGFFIISWNVENLFDTEDDPLTRDDEFTPEGSRHWSNGRYYRKLNRVYKAIVMAGGREPPTFIGLCEIENGRVLRNLVFNTPLENDGYRYLHRESPDRRGIDVAFLYLASRFYVLEKEWIAVQDVQDTSFVTRDILYLKGVLDGYDTLHFFINHWPSRYGGYASTVALRKLAARHLDEKVMELFVADRAAKVIVMGDFNDEPDDPSIEYLMDSQEGKLINLFDGEKGKGTVKYRGKWTLFDQIIVSQGLASEYELDAGIFDPPVLLVRDRSYTGEKPFRTYVGYRYQGGFSDHLPVFLRGSCHQQPATSNQ